MALSPPAKIATSRLQEMEQRLNLRKPIYQPTAAYGHFGRNSTPEGLFSWEKTDLVDELKKACF